MKHTENQRDWMQEMKDRCSAPLLMLFALLLAFSLAMTSSTSAGPNANAKIAIHLMAPTSKNPCGRAGALPNCAGILTSGTLYPTNYFAYVIATDIDSTGGLAGAQFGIDYANEPNVGVDVYQWTSCAEMQFPTENWPAAGSGNMVTWNFETGCQRTQPDGPGSHAAAVIGYFYCTAYSPDILSITPRPTDTVASVASCNGAEDLLETSGWYHDPSYLGNAVFSTDGTMQGSNPCGIENEVVYRDACQAKPIIAKPSDSHKCEQTLGSFVLGSHSVLYVRGRLLKGQVIATFRDGVSYLNGIRWQAADSQAEETSQRKTRTEIKPPAQVPATNLQALLRVPFIEVAVRQGLSPSSAATLYLARRKSTISVMNRILMRDTKLSTQLLTSHLSSMVDKQVASMGGVSNSSPGAESTSSYMLHFPGYLDHMTTLVPGERFDAIAGTAPLTLGIAQSRFNKLAMYMKWRPGPSIGIYTAQASFLATGDDAARAISEIADSRALQNGESSVLRSTLVPAEFYRELVQEEGAGKRAR